MLQIVRGPDSEDFSDLLPVLCRSRLVVMHKHIGLDAGPIHEKRAVSRHDYLMFPRNLSDNFLELVDGIRMKVGFRFLNRQYQVSSCSAAFRCVTHDAERSEALHPIALPDQLRRGAVINNDLASTAESSESFLLWDAYSDLSNIR